MPAETATDNGVVTDHEELLDAMYLYTSSESWNEDEA